MRKFLHIIIYIGAVLFCVPAQASSDGGSFIVVLDAGHGGKDPGTIGSVPSHREKDIAFNITMEVGRLLRNNHPEIKIIYTRSTDVFIELGRRAEIANKAKADLFVSIHVNALPKGATHYAYGVQSYTLSLKSTGTNLEVEKRENSVIALEGEAAKKYNYNASAESNIMFELMQDHDMKESVAFAKMAQNEMVQTGGRKDMGVRQANLAVLRLTYMPSVLLEVGFISTPAEEKFLMTRDGQNLMAKSIYNAIAKYASQRTGKKAKLEQPNSVPTQTALVQTSEPATTATIPANVSANNTQTSPTGTAQVAGNSSGPQAISTSASQTPHKTPSSKTTVYKVQVLAGIVKLKSNDKQFKGLKCEMHQQKNGRYTYTYGSATTLNEAKKLRQSIIDKFPQAFIVTFEE